MNLFLNFCVWVAFMLFSFFISAVIAIFMHPGTNEETKEEKLQCQTSIGYWILCMICSFMAVYILNLHNII